MVNLIVSSEDIGKAVPNPEDRSGSYWNPQNHDTDNYLRMDHWMQDVKEFMFEETKPPATISLSHEEASTLLRFRDDVKFFAALEDEQRGKESSGEAKWMIPLEWSWIPSIYRYFTSLISSSKEQNQSSEVQPWMAPLKWLWIPSIFRYLTSFVSSKQNPIVEAINDAEFLTKSFCRVREHWEQSPGLTSRVSCLNSLEKKLDETILSMGTSGAFIKLSVRSPKDASMCSKHLMQLIKERTLSKEAEKTDVAGIIRYAAWKAMCVTNGTDAIDLLLRSERVYIDLLQQELFAQANGGFDLNIHVSQFFSGFEPNWEFRAFVANGKKTCLSVYSPFVYDADIVFNKEKILELIQTVWDKVIPRIKSKNYCVDFAVKPDLTRCWIVEVNDFLPPLAGSGVFNYHNDIDRMILMNGPFEFRVVDQPIHPNNLVKQVSENVTIQYEVGPPHVMEFANKCLADAGRMSIET
eukprot:Awhi_evm1s2746